MKIVQYLFIASCIITSQSTQTAWPEGMNGKIFDLYVQKACIKIAEINVQLQLEQLTSGNIGTGQNYADVLYARQKAIFKTILKELELKKNDKKNEFLSQHFKNEVYKSWKREFKSNYKNSAQNNDIHAWDWVYKPMGFPIHE